MSTSTLAKLREAIASSPLRPRSKASTPAGSQKGTPKGGSPPEATPNGSIKGGPAKGSAMKEALAIARGGSGSAKSSGSFSSRRSEDRARLKQEKAEKRERIQSEIDERRRLEDEKAKQEEDEQTQARYGEADEHPAHPLELSRIEELADMAEGTEVTFRARIHTQRRISAALDFLLFRDQTHSIQGVMTSEHCTPHMVKWVQRLHPESLIQVTGTLKKPIEPVKSARVPDLEVLVYSIHLISAAEDLPFDNYYMNQESLHKRMTARVLDLRHPSNQALFRIRAAILREYRRKLDDLGFIEINTPKLQAAVAESGAEVFKVNYFGRRAVLAQSPQLNKQMSISADFKRVYEIGPVFRAENSNTKRHLAEYTGLDVEMEITNDYHEVINTVDSVLKSIFAAISKMPEIQVVRERWPSEDLQWLEQTPVIPFKEGIQMLRDDGRDVEEEDLSTRDEIRLGELVKEKYKTDYYILDKFPASARPFYTHPDENDPFWTNSFDIFLRGQEICSGGQRIHNPKKLRESLEKANLPEEDMEEYLSAFDLGAPPHGGAGLGLERVVAFFLNLGDVRFGTMYYRDPKSLPERSPSLPHPDSDTTKPHPEGKLPPLENLIANYGDATNTSWLDDRFEIWRHHTGAAVGYNKRDKFVMVVGDPLCDVKQYRDVIGAFLEFVEKDLKMTPVWMLVSDYVQRVLGEQMGWRTLTCTEEQRVDADKHVTPSGHHARRVEREGIKIHEVRPNEDFIKRTDESIEAWKNARKGIAGKQVHLTDVRPWIDQVHRRYFAAEKDGKVLALVVLARLAPRYGWQLKWALDFPGTPNGTIETLIEFALSGLSGPVTFGAGVSQRLTPGAHLHGVRAKFLSNVYDTVVKTLNLSKKSEFRQKFGAYGEQIYICYPRHSLKVTDFQHIIGFFRE
ncbi:putative aspartyl-trna synthetase protein [Phaeoacremonium minimum UCRPA7]|uniref:Probable aspartate--tRNA ligase, cytoplasmic n=1 Tax=Phaeoacremonium minimum (strain UCR-PA7) TaxID=1286976 RepID=R8BEX4_PHAM7|nr:putative aspartyl-trna synthetase protein [Phaeoacremonium minimum UCRPA7]EON97849.1 putative aspartyl-trna synthetase protein [Phaeoacremonium minimum UCRPA7]